MKTRAQAEYEWFHGLNPGIEPAAEDVSEAFKAGWYAAMKEIVRFCEDCPICDEARIKAQRFG